MAQVEEGVQVFLLSRPGLYRFPCLFFFFFVSSIYPHEPSAVHETERTFVEGTVRKIIQDEGNSTGLLDLKDGIVWSSPFSVCGSRISNVLLIP